MITTYVPCVYALLPVTHQNSSQPHNNIRQESHTEIELEDISEGELELEDDNIGVGKITNWAEEVDSKIPLETVKIGAVENMGKKLK